MVWKLTTALIAIHATLLADSPPAHDQLTNSLTTTTTTPLDQIHPRHLARILTLSDEHIEYYINRNHRFTKLSPEEKEKARRDLIEFRNTKRAEALKRASLLGLQVPEDQINDFIETYWRMQLEMERRIEAHVRPMRQQMEAENLVELQRRFSPKVTRGENSPTTPTKQPVNTPKHPGNSGTVPDEDSAVAMLKLL